MADLHRAAEMIVAARRVLVLTGAGVSAESGVPTFRDAMEGLWARFDPAELATPEAFARDPAMVTRWYDERRQRVLACSPNPGHEAIAALERWAEAGGREFLLCTQNVDRLHQRAGSRRVVELHGSLMVWRCTRTGSEREDLPMPLPEHPMPSEAGGLYRPGVVWFGEMLPETALRAAQEAIEACDVVLSVGTSAVVQPAASFVEWAMSRGANAIEVNRDPTPISGAVDVSIRGKAGEVLPRLVEALG